MLQQKKWLFFQQAFKGFLIGVTKQSYFLASDFSYCFLKDKASPLWIASQMGHTQIVRELLTLGADVDAVREVGLPLLIEIEYLMLIHDG